MLLDAFILYILSFMVLWSQRRGRVVRRVIELVYRPLTWIGLWHGWTMYAPEVPDHTRIIVAGVLFGDGTFEVVPLPGLADDSGFERANGLRFISFQYKLNLKVTNYIKPALCAYALEQWRGRRRVSDAPPGDGRQAAQDASVAPVAVELREYLYPSPKPGGPRDEQALQIRTVWSEEVQV